MTTKIPAELSSTPGIVDSSNATAITIDSSEEVGIGSTSPSAKLEVLSSSNSTYLKVGGDDSGTNARALTFTSASGTSLAGAVHIINAPSIQGQIALQTNNGERARITGNGITFNGDTAAANALDDYEEGSYTPTSSASLTIQYANYTKIGRLVFLNVDITVGTYGSSNSFNINLPFNGVDAYYGGVVNYNSASEPDMVVNLDNQSGVYFRTSPTGSNINYTNMSGKRLIFSIVYTTAS